MASALETSLRDRRVLLSVLRDTAATWAVLNELWTRGASQGEPHPLIDVLLGDTHRQRRDDLELGLAVLSQSAQIPSRFRQRLLIAARESYDDVVAAISELYVAARFASAGALVTFVSPMRNQRTPDLAITVGTDIVAVEIMALHISSTARRAGDALVTSFHNWPRGAETPANLRGRASDRGHVRFLERVVMPLGEGTHAQRIERVITKLNEKANGGQLSGYANRLLVVGLWHQFGIGPSDCEAAASTEPSPILRTAMFGRLGAKVRDPDDLHGPVASTLSQDGVLVTACDAQALLWLFQNHEPVLACHRREGLAPQIRQVVRRSFGAKSLR